MPHIIVKLWPGKTAAQKQLLSDAIVENVKSIFGSADESVSVAFEVVQPDDWSSHVYEAEIQAKWDMLTKQPGYGPGPFGKEKGR